MSQKETLIFFGVFAPVILVLFNSGVITTFIKYATKPSLTEVYDANIIKNIEIATSLNRSKGEVSFDIKNGNDVILKNLVLECEYSSETDVKFSNPFEQKLYYFFPKKSNRKIEELRPSTPLPNQANKISCLVTEFELPEISK